MTGLRGTRGYNCPGCDREPVISYMRTTLHRFGNNGLVCNISCGERDGGLGSMNECLGQWFKLRPFVDSQTAVAEWNNAIIDMAAAALGISRRDALALKERRARVVNKEQTAIGNTVGNTGAAGDDQNG